MTAFGDSPADQPGDPHRQEPGSEPVGPASPRQTPRSSQVAAAAFLRVYEPVTAAAAARSVTRSASDQKNGRAANPLPLGGAEHAAALRAASALPPRVVGDLDLLSSDDDATVRPSLPLWPPASDGVPRSCPMDLSWRASIALEEFRQSVQPEVMSAFLPPEAVAQAFAVANRQVDAAPRGRDPHIRTCAWHVPLPWLVLFCSDERCEGLLRYRAAMADARRELARALAVVRRTPTDFLTVRRLEDVGRWLEEFHPRSIVELDFDGLAPMVSADELGAGNSVALMDAALAALRAGDTQQGLAGLSAIKDRWGAVRAFERAN